MNYNTFTEMYNQAKQQYPEDYKKLLDIWISDWLYAKDHKSRYKGSRHESYNNRK